MNEELKKLAVQAGAPVEVLDELWFNLFCQQFADIILTNAELELANVKNRISELES
jgi:hypothetical protein